MQEPRQALHACARGRQQEVERALQAARRSTGSKRAGNCARGRQATAAGLGPRLLCSGRGRTHWGAPVLLRSAPCGTPTTYSGDRRRLGFLSRAR